MFGKYYFRIALVSIFLGGLLLAACQPAEYRNAAKEKHQEEEPLKVLYIPQQVKVGGIKSLQYLPVFY
jgi:hypothetical protein